MPSPRIYLRSTLILCLLLLNACAARTLPPPDEGFLAFPQGFLWGTATAAYQVEGGITNNWSAAGVDAGLAVDHLHRYEADYDEAKKLGTNAYRMSIEWARLEPEPGKYDQAAIKQYHAMLTALRARGIEPMVTLFHFTQPIWFAEKGGFEHEANLADFTRFARFAAKEFGTQVTWWCTLNEPEVHGFKSYDQGVWPPFKKDRNLALHVIRNLMLAHGYAYRAIHAEDVHAKVGFAKHIALLQPNWGLNPVDHLMTNIQSYLFNETFWEAIEKGSLDVSLPGLEPIRIPHTPELVGAMDYIGINYYTRYLIEASGAQLTRPGSAVSDLNWELYPAGMLEVMRMAKPHADKLRIPIVITENGLADADDSRRRQFLVEHLAAIWQASREGIPVAGYFHWSLMDNFEWTDGYAPQFGLMDKDRKWRPSAGLYRQIATANGFPASWLQQLPEPAALSQAH